MVQIIFDMIVLGGAVFTTFILPTLPTVGALEHNEGTLAMDQSERSTSLDAYFELAQRT